MSPAQNYVRAIDQDCWAAMERAPLFTGVSSDDFSRISSASRLKSFARDEMLYSEGDRVEHVFLLNSGLVKITQREVILRLFAPGDVIDAVGLFSTGRHCTTAQAIRGCDALVWDARIFKDLIECLPVLHRNLTQAICGQFLEFEERFREVANERVARRVARQLIRLQEQVGSPQKGGVEISLSRECLAQMTATTEFTVSRLLSTWEEHGLVTCGRESVMISDVRALHKVFE